MSNEEFIEQLRAILAPDSFLPTGKWTCQSPGTYGIEVKGITSLVLYHNRKMVAHIQSERGDEVVLHHTLALGKGDTLGIVGEVVDTPHFQAVPRR